MKILVTGGAGFIGSHIAEYYSKRGEEVIVYDNLSRAEILGKEMKNITYNWEYLREKHPGITLLKYDIRDLERLRETVEGVDVIFHTAAQTAVTTSVIDPQIDFSVNVEGTFNVLQVARESKKKPAIIFCSTNKVYGDNVNSIRVIEEEKHYRFEDKYEKGIPEEFPIDLCEHTPYGCSKLTGDIYTQDYGHLYGLKIGVFRMSCIYGEKQFGVEDQGWVAHFVISTLLGRPITIYGDGKQVRDVLYVTDLIEAYDRFLTSDLKLGVFNIGGGHKNKISLLELLDIIAESTGKRSEIRFADWRPSDQKVYISNLSRIKQLLGWEPKTDIKLGIKNLIDWVVKNKEIF